MKIAVDAMGGDHAPDEIVRGALLYRTSGGEADLVLVGREQELRRILGSALPPGISRSISLSITSGSTLRSRNVIAARTIVATVTIEQSSSGHMKGPPLFMKVTIV